MLGASLIIDFKHQSLQKLQTRGIEFLGFQVCIVNDTHSSKHHQSLENVSF